MVAVVGAHRATDGKVVLVAMTSDYVIDSQCKDLQRLMHT